MEGQATSTRSHHLSHNFSEDLNERIKNTFVDLQWSNFRILRPVQPAGIWPWKVFPLFF